MSTRVRRLKAIIAILVVTTLSMLGMLGVVVHRYNQSQEALVKCYGVADAGVFYILGAQSEHQGSLQTAKAQRAGGDAALAALGEDDIVEAMERCDYARWVN